VEYAVQLPPSYAGGEARYPALYVLHGLFEDHGFWERRGLAAFTQEGWKAGDLPEMVVVTVNGGRSFFMNGLAGNYEDMVAGDLVAHVEATYRVRPGRENRSLLGISMGGYGALRIALVRPEIFGAVATHSAMVLLKLPTAEDGARRGQMAAFHGAFGDPIDPERWRAADPLALAGSVDPKKTPRLHFDCGSEDRYGLAAGNEELHRRLETRGVAHRFSLHPGDHGYDYVRTRIAHSLAFLAGRPAPASP
jgi:S-formylglutathione hydrolase FrmB